MNSDQQTAPKLQTKLRYFIGSAAVRDRTGILEWSADDRIRLFQIDSKDYSLIGKVFDLAPSDIQSIGGVGSSLSINYQDTHCSFIFSTTGVITGNAGFTDDPQSESALEWLRTFREHNVKITYWGKRKFIKATLITCLVVFLVFVPILLIVFSILIPMH